MKNLIKKIQIHLVFMVIAGGLFLTFVTQGYLHQKLEKYNHNSNSVIPIVILRDVVIVGRDRGKKRWEVAAPSVVLGKDKRDIVCKGSVNAVIYNDKQPFLHVKGSFIKMQMNTNSFFLQNGVELRRQNGDERLITDEMTWDAVKGEFICPRPILVISPKGTFKAKQLKGNTKTGEMILEEIQLLADPDAFLQK